MIAVPPKNAFESSRPLTTPSPFRSAPPPMMVGPNVPLNAFEGVVTVAPSTCTTPRVRSWPRKQPSVHVSAPVLSPSLFRSTLPLSAASVGFPHPHGFQFLTALPRISAVPTTSKEQSLASLVSCPLESTRPPCLVDHANAESEISGLSPSPTWGNTVGKGPSGQSTAPSSTSIVTPVGEPS